MDKRYLQAHKEARISLYITALYLISWVISAYFLADEQGVLGFPAWFEISCILAPIGFILICYLVVKYRFKDIPLGKERSEQKLNQ
ncbi:YhdT family protein [Orbus sturtevantii]|uniref:YhdT family protein n=1 Tax=Orbus sturtevantii TaxID=3074109 RepID=UPI00370D87BF